MDVLIVGAGIAGLSAAQQFFEQGCSVTLVERAAEPRDAGYMIDFFGPGFDAAERQGLLPALAEIHYPVPSLVFADTRGRVRCEMDYPELREKVFGGRHFNFMRGDLERALRERLDAGIEVRWGTTLDAVVRNDEHGVQVRTSGGRLETYDLVVGADGVHSRTRALTLPTRARLVPLAARTAAFVIGRDLGLDPERFTSVVTVGRTAAAYPIRGGSTATLFVWAAGEADKPRSPEGCLRQLEVEFARCGTLTDALLGHLHHARDVFCDDLVYVQLSPWSRGRVVLLGDAAGCVSLLAGQGASLALAGAYILAQELGRSDGDVGLALCRYERRMRPAVEGRQRSALRSRSWFLPPSALRARLQLSATHYLLRSPAAGWFGASLGGGSIDLDPPSE